MKLKKTELKFSLEGTFFNFINPLRGTPTPKYGNVFLETPYKGELKGLIAIFVVNIALKIDYILYDKLYYYACIIKRKNGCFVFGKIDEEMDVYFGKTKISKIKRYTIKALKHGEKNSVEIFDSGNSLFKIIK